MYGTGKKSTQETSTRPYGKILRHNRKISRTNWRGSAETTLAVTAFNDPVSGNFQNFRGQGRGYLTQVTQVITHIHKETKTAVGATTEETSMAEEEIEGIAETIAEMVVARRP